MSMNPALKEAWVAALRSGKYKQGVGVLRNAKDEYCCLGVLCDLIDPDAWVEDTANDEVLWKPVIGGVMHEMDVDLDVIPREEIGITADDQRELIDMNDEMGYSFGRIASYIEHKL